MKKSPHRFRRLIVVVVVVVVSAFTSQLTLSSLPDWWNRIKDRYSMEDVPEAPAWQLALGHLIAQSADAEGVPQGTAGKYALLKLGIANGSGLKSNGTRGAPEASVQATEPVWKALEVLLAATSHASSSTDVPPAGATAGHSREACTAAAAKLVANHKAVLYDITHPAPLTQHTLERLDEGLRPFVDEALCEVARRLLSHRPGNQSIAQRCDPSSGTQIAAWVGTCKYLDGRLQSADAEKPGRTPDMSPEAAKAMRAVLLEVMDEPVAATLNAAAQDWQLAEGLLEARQRDPALLESVDELAEHSRQARWEAAAALIYNRKRVLMDVTNPLWAQNIVGKPLTQRELQRVARAHVVHADEALRRSAIWLLQHLEGGDMAALTLPKPSSEVQASAWMATAVYLDSRIQSTAEEKPGRKPDMSSSAACAMRQTLHLLHNEAVMYKLSAMLIVHAKEAMLSDESPHLAGRISAASQLISHSRKIVQDVIFCPVGDNGAATPASHPVRVYSGLPAIQDSLLGSFVKHVRPARSKSSAYTYAPQLCDACACMRMRPQHACTRTNHVHIPQACHYVTMACYMPPPDPPKTTSRRSPGWPSQPGTA